MGDGRLTWGRPAVRAAVLALGVIAAGAALAQDAPHWIGARLPIDCTSQCHVPHHALGGNLTGSADNVNLCQSCHVTSGDATDLAVDSAHMAIPGQSGIHHAFGACAVNSNLDTQLPNDTQMSLRVMGADGPCPSGYIVCSTCHNQHKAEAAYGGDSRISPAREVAVSGTGVLGSAGTFTGAEGVWYRIQIVQSGVETTALFRYTKDNGLSWFPSACDPGAPSEPACKRANGLTPVLLDQPVDEGVAVTFSSGTYNADDEWEFSAAWSFLRRTLPLANAPDSLIDSGDNATGDRYCRDCHRTWVMDTADVRTYNSGSTKSHPVGITYPSAGQFYHSTPLDGDGSASDANPTNDLRFDAAGSVQCLTCHGVHYVDSNTLTVDGP